MNGELFIKLKSFFFPFSDSFLYIFGRFFKTECRTFLRMALLQFFISYWAKFFKLIRFITQSCLSILNSLFLLVWSTFSIFLKSLSDYFFSWLDYKPLLNRFSVLINYSVLDGRPIIFLHPAVSHVFHGPGPGFRNSRLIKVPLLYEYLRGWLHVYFHPGVKLKDGT